MKKILIDTSSKAKSLNFFILIFFLATLIIPFVIINFLENSLVAVFLTSNTYIILLLILINIIFLFLGCYYSQLKIDSYIINIYSSRFNNNKKILDIKHDMLNSFYFKKSFFSWNTILYINYVKKNNINITRKFFFTFLSLRERDKITDSLNKILKYNE
jgi:hypothetical protein